MHFSKGSVYFRKPRLFQWNLILSDPCFRQCLQSSNGHLMVEPFRILHGLLPMNCSVRLTQCWSVICSRSATTHVRDRLQESCANFCSVLRCTSYRASSEQLSLEMLSERGALNVGVLNSFVATGRPGPKFTRTVGKLVDVLVEFVFPSTSESSVAFLLSPQLMTTHETALSICKEFILISIQYLPYG